MGYSIPRLTAAEILAAITDDSTKFSGADIDAAISTAGGVQDGVIRFYSSPSADFAVDTTAGDQNLEDVAIPNLSGLTIDYATAGIIAAAIGDTSGASNFNNTTQYIQVDKDAAGYINAIQLTAKTIYLSANGWAFAVLIAGNIDISSRTAFNATTNFKWALADAQGNDLKFRGVVSYVELIVS